MVMFFIFGFTIFYKIENVLGHFENVHRFFSESKFSETTFSLEFLMKPGLFLLPNLP